MFACVMATALEWDFIRLDHSYFLNDWDWHDSGKLERNFTRLYEQHVEIWTFSQTTIVNDIHQINELHYEWQLWMTIQLYWVWWITRAVSRFNCVMCQVQFCLYLLFKSISRTDCFFFVNGHLGYPQGQKYPRKSILSVGVYCRHYWHWAISRRLM